MKHLYTYVVKANEKHASKLCLELEKKKDVERYKVKRDEICYTIFVDSYLDEDDFRKWVKSRRVIKVYGVYAREMMLLEKGEIIGMVPVSIEDMEKE